MSASPAAVSARLEATHWRHLQACNKGEDCSRQYLKSEWEDPPVARVAGSLASALTSATQHCSQGALPVDPSCAVFLKHAESVLARWAGDAALQEGAPADSDVVRSATEIAKLAATSALAITLKCHTLQPEVAVAVGNSAALVCSPDTTTTVQHGIALQHLQQVHCTAHPVLQQRSLHMQAHLAQATLPPPSLAPSGAARPALAALAAAVAAAVQQVQSRPTRDATVLKTLRSPSQQRQVPRGAWANAAQPASPGRIGGTMSVTTVGVQQAQASTALTLALSSTAEGRMHAVEALQPPSLSEGSGLQAFFPGAASRQRVMLLAARLPAGTLSDAGTGEHTHGAVVSVVTHELPNYLDLLPSLAQLFLMYCPGEVQSGQAAGATAVRKEGGGTEDMHHYVAKALGHQGSRVRLPEAGIRALLGDMGVCPGLLAPTDITVLCLMTVAGCPPVLAHPRRATQMLPTGASSTTPGPAVGQVGSRDLVRQSRELARTSVPFRTDSGGVDTGEGSGTIMMSADALLGHGRLSTSFTQFLDVLGRCALTVVPRSTGPLGGPACPPPGGKAGTMARIEGVLIDQLQLHEQEAWAPRLPHRMWFTRFPQLQEAARRHRRAAEEEGRDGSSAGFVLAPPAAELMRRRVPRHCLSRAMKAAADVPMAIPCDQLEALLGGGPPRAGVQTEVCLTPTAFQRIVSEVMDPLDDVEQLMRAFTAVQRPMLSVRRSRATDCGLAPTVGGGEAKDIIQRGACMLVPESAWGGLWGRLAWQVHVGRARRACAAAGQDTKTALAQTPQLQVQAVEALLAALAIDPGMSRTQLRAWVAGPLLQRLAKPPPCKQSSHSGLSGGSHSSISSAVLAGGASWVGMHALKRLGRERGGKGGRGGVHASAPSTQGQAAFHPLRFAPR